MAKKIVMPRLGEYWEEQGGVRCGQMRGVAGRPDYELILPIADSVKNLRAAWGGYGKDFKGATCSFDGQANTAALAKSRTKYPAAWLCAGLIVAGFSDLYLPARREARLLWINASEHIDTEGWYLTSTQYSPVCAYVQDFANGNQTDDRKRYEARVRPVRRLII